jgi:hypothetical protein
MLMQAVTDRKELEPIVNVVRKYLQPHQPDDYRLDVVESAIGREDEWYYVVVEPDRDGVRSNDYASRLVEAELDLQEKEKLNILLVPALPQ